MAAITIVIKGTKCIATTKGAWAGSRNLEQNKLLAPTGLIKAGRE